MKIIGYIISFWAIYDIVLALYGVKKGLSFYGNDLFRDFKNELLKVGKEISGDILVLVYVVYHLVN